jgi:aldose 1-epimerase
MSFSVFTKLEYGFQQLVLINEDTATEIVILPEHGASLHQFTVQTDKGAVNCIDNYKDVQELELKLKNSYKSSKLSPFPCRIRNAKYTFQGQHFEFDNKFPDGSAIHGLLYNRHFEITGKFFDDEKAYVQLEYRYDKEDQGFPFTYLCQVRYTLLPSNLLQIETTIINTDSVSIPMADGWHPYFTLGGNADDWQLKLNIKSMVEFDNDLIPTGRFIPNHLFKNQVSLLDIELDNCFVVDDYNKSACTLSNPSTKVSLDFFPSSSYPYLQIYTPPDRKSIAIENLSSPPDCFNNQIDLTILAPGERKNFAVSYQLNTG